MACSVLGSCGAVVGGGGPAQVLPLFAVEVLQCACRAEAVRFEVCAGEADAATASLARELRCCALSQDSDFFVFDIPAGALQRERCLSWSGVFVACVPRSHSHDCGNTA